MALYTPFFQRAAQGAAGAYGQRRTSELTQSAYMGDPRAFQELARIDPNAANQIRQQKMQEEQVQLAQAAQRQQMQANQQQMRQQTQQWAVQNRELVQGIMQKAAQMPDFPSAQQFIASEIQGLQQSGVEVPQAFSAQTFTPEAFEQIKKAFPKEGQAFTLGDGETRYGPNGEVLATNTKDEDPKTYQEASAMRQEFSALAPVKQFAEQSASIGRIEAAAADPSAAGDLALIFSYMKVLDPGSTVREGEFANAQNAGGVDDRVRSAYNKVINGERLSEEQRADFVDRGQRLYRNAEAGFMRTYDQYKNIATRRGLPVEDALIDYRYKPSSSAPPALAAGQVVDGYKFLGGNPADPASWEQQ